LSETYAGPRASRIAVALCAFAYLYAFPYQPGLNNPNENVRFYMSAALVEEGHYQIDTQRVRWGWVNDAAVRDAHVYSVKAPAASLLAVPGYALYLWVWHDALRHPFDRTEALWLCRVTGVILPSLVFLYLLHRFFVRLGYPPLLRDAVFYSIALGSLLYGYSLLLVSHALCAAAAFGAFMLLFRCRQRRQASLVEAFFAGLLAAAVTLLEYPGLPCSIVLSVYATFVLWKLARLRGLLAFAAGGLGPALVLMHFQWRAFGSPFTPGHLMVENEAFRAAHEQGLYGAVGPSLPALRGLLIDLGAGLFPLTPVLIFAPWGVYLMLRDRERRADAVCVLAVVVSSVLVIASMNNWRGGWTIGPRYLALCVPFLGWLALHALAAWASTPRRTFASSTLALAATAVGLLASGVPSVYYPHLPPEFTRPIPQLFALLIAHDFAPFNAAAALGVYGSPSMLPLLVCAWVALGSCLLHVRGARTRLRLGAAALACALVLSTPLLSRPNQEPGVAKATAFVTRRFQPAGHDRAARLVERLRVEPSPPLFELLARTYDAEGRALEASRARKGRL
jgi:hypothetical protein